jgi:hypothetical protein
MLKASSPAVFLVLLSSDYLFSINSMSQSIFAKQKIEKKRRRGRPATGFDPMIGLRLAPEMRQEIEDWAAEQSPPLTFSEAIRRLLDDALKRVRKAKR